MITLADVLRETLSGDEDFEAHGYVSCSDESPVNAERGCYRCIVIEYVKDDQAKRYPKGIVVIEKE